MVHRANFKRICPWKIQGLFIVKWNPLEPQLLSTTKGRDVTNWYNLAVKEPARSASSAELWDIEGGFQSHLRMGLDFAEANLSAQFGMIPCFTAFFRWQRRPYPRRVLPAIPKTFLCLGPLGSAKSLLTARRFSERRKVGHGAIWMCPKKNSSGMGFPTSHLDLDHEMEDYKGPGILDTPACLVSEGVCSQGPYWFGCESMNVAVLSTNEHGTSTSGTPKKSCGDDPFWIFLTCRKMGSMFTKGVCSTLNAAPPHENCKLANKAGLVTRHGSGSSSATPLECAKQVVCCWKPGSHFCTHSTSGVCLTTFYTFETLGCLFSEFFPTAGNIWPNTLGQFFQRLYSGGSSSQHLKCFGHAVSLSSSS